MSGEDVRVEVRGLETFGPHGVSEAERERGTRVVLDIGLTVRGSAAPESDELGDTVDYGEVTRLAAAVVAGESCRTLERLCGLIAAAIEERFDVADLEIRAAKPDPPMAEVVEDVAVTLRRGTGS